MPHVPLFIKTLKCRISTIDTPTLSLNPSDDHVTVSNASPMYILLINDTQHERGDTDVEQTISISWIWNTAVESMRVKGFPIETVTIRPTTESTSGFGHSGRWEAVDEDGLWRDLLVGCQSSIAAVLVRPDGIIASVAHAHQARDAKEATQFLSQTFERLTKPVGGFSQ
jgi:hypothetical protein